MERRFFPAGLRGVWWGCGESGGAVARHTALLPSGLPCHEYPSIRTDFLPVAGLTVIFADKKILRR
jgi:hypothetical protein